MVKLSLPFSNLREVEDAIGEYQQLEEKQSFNTLQYVLDELFSSEERLHFFQEVFPGIVELAKELPTRLSNPVPILRAGNCGRHTFDQATLASLLANMFLCTFQRQDFGLGRDCVLIGRFDFLRLLSSPDFLRGANANKLRCFLDYFKTIVARKKSGDKLSNEVWFERRSAPDIKWDELSATFADVNFSMRAEGTIEDADLTGTAWQADFANAYIGGGVLGRGCVQEEIRFAISPELCVSKLLMERMRDDEAILIGGSERFCNYKGYASGFTFDGGHADESAVEGGCRLTTVTCFDAMHFGPGLGSQIKQFHPSAIRRELTKALAAFQPTAEMERKPRSEWPAVVTGNWGCGAFGGVVELKFVIQLMAAAATGRAIVYMALDTRLAERLQDLHSALVDRGATIAETLQDLRTLFQLQHSKGELLDMTQFFRDCAANAETLERGGEEHAVVGRSAQREGNRLAGDGGKEGDGNVCSRAAAACLRTLASAWLARPKAKNKMGAAGDAGSEEAAMGFSASDPSVELYVPV